MRRLILAALALVASVAPSRATAAEPTGTRPNVLMIAVDDLNHGVGYLGRNAQTITPNIDRLASRGVRFTHSYCAAPLCNSSRAALMSGKRPSTTGVYTNSQDWRSVVPEDQPLTSAFRQAGYAVLGSGKIYHGNFARRNEWDDYLASEGPKPPQPPVGNRGVGTIKFGVINAEDSDIPDWNIVNYGIQQLERTHAKPFFLAVGLHKPHMPWNVPQKYFDLHPLDSIELPPTQPDDLADVPPAGREMAHPNGDHRRIVESGRWKEAVQAYLAAVSYSDAMIGRLLEALDRSPHRDNTIVVLWGDHGWHLGEKEHWRKFALWEEATRAPLIWVVPGVTKPDTVCERTVDFMSIYPTLTELAGIPTPSHVEGRSIAPLLRDPASEWSTPAVTTFGLNNHAARSEGWRYIRYANGDEELYDETSDPYEWTNLADRPEHAARKAELAQAFPTINVPDIEPKNKNNAARAERRRLRREQAAAAKS
jgi:arylsulfatase A-like enzyme